MAYRKHAAPLSMRQKRSLPLLLGRINKLEQGGMLGSHCLAACLLWLSSLPPLLPFTSLTAPPHSFPPTPWLHQITNSTINVKLWIGYSPGFHWPCPKSGQGIFQSFNNNRFRSNILKYSSIWVQGQIDIRSKRNLHYTRIGCLCETNWFVKIDNPKQNYPRDLQWLSD